MIKLFCINSDGWIERVKFLWFFKYWKECSGPTYGEVVTVIGSYYDEGELYYELREWPPGKNNDGYEASCFIPISNVDEQSILEEREYEKTKRIHQYPILKRDAYMKK